jgi:Undecaprenyl-phosphate galactose phosphotransferase WbaP
VETTYENSSQEKSKKNKIKTLPKWVVTPYCRVIMTVWLIIADLISLFLSGFLAIQIRAWMGADLPLKNYYSLTPMLVLFIIGYAFVGLYPGIGVNTIEELRRTTYASSIMMISLSVLLFLTQTGLSYSRLIFLFIWMFALVFVPVIRLIARKLGVRLGIWGEPVALIGVGSQGKHIYRYLQNNPIYGIRPVVVVNAIEDPEDEVHDELFRTPEINVSDLVNDNLLLARAGIKTAILAPFEIPQALRSSLVDEQKFGLDRLILISDLNWIGGSAVVTHDLDGLLGLEVERNLFHIRERLIKHFLDFSVTIFLLIFGFPFLVLFAILIRLDSTGPIIYKQRRVGKAGKEILIWKFRTMVYNADEILENYLSTNQEYFVEWEKTHKIKNDPRITRVGKFLRRTSLDELPQLINVLKGEMSLAGPRPIVQDEIKLYKDGYNLYTQVLPGVSGLWQVSGRSDASYEYRVALDAYYIRHWSIWMDIYIFIRTVWVVIKRSGAY